MQLCEPFPDRRESACIGRRIGTRRAANRRLVDIDDLVEIISHVKENKEISVRAIRPTKVSQYLFEEAERLARDMPSTFDRETTATQLHSWTELFGDKFETGSKGFKLLSSVTEKFELKQ